MKNEQIATWTNEGSGYTLALLGHIAQYLEAISAQLTASVRRR